MKFAAHAQSRGASTRAAALEATWIRLRPILMTSLAFIFGVWPLTLSTGPGVQSRIAIGTSVPGGMLSAIVLVVAFVPPFFVLARQQPSAHTRIDHAPFGVREIQLLLVGRFP